MIHSFEIVGRSFASVWPRVRESVCDGSDHVAGTLRVFLSEKLDEGLAVILGIVGTEDEGCDQPRGAF